jgi:hypothetical protein
MSAPTIVGTSTSFGIAAQQTTMQITNAQASATSNKAEAKNINGGTAAVVFFAKKAEYNVEGFVTATNSVTVGGALTPSNLAGIGGMTGGYYVEEVSMTKSSEDFSKLKYKIVQRDGVA